MVVVDYPDNTCRKFFMYDNTMFGPIDSNGDYRAVSVDLPLQEERFEPKKGIYGENDIIHSSFHGRIFYYPILADCVPVPSAQNPRAIKVPIKESPVPVLASYGFGCPDNGALVCFSVAQCIQQAVHRDPATRSWRLVRCICSNPASLKCYVYIHDLSFKRWISPTQIELTRKFQYSIYSVPWPYGWARAASYQQIMDRIGAVTRWSSPTTATRTADVYTTDPSAVVSPSKLAQNLETFADQLMNSEFPIQEKDYGDMAALAIKQKRTVDVNIYEFLRDLKNPKSMIPKLKNLSMLKTHANNLLAVEYGILPTISDLREIVGAFKARLPYLDRFGNTVYNSSNVVRVDIGNGVYTLAQYIKVPVANEDNEFLKLLDELDKYGLGLTFENVWDLVKYSFVIDWFINVGGFLERVDNNLRLIRYNIPYVTMSRKKTVFGEIPQNTNLATIGPIEWRYYHRWVSSHCPLPPLTLSTSSTPTSHWLEGGALIIQRAH